MMQMQNIFKYSFKAAEVIIISILKCKNFWLPFVL